MGSNFSKGTGQAHNKAIESAGTCFAGELSGYRGYDTRGLSWKRRSREQEVSGE